MTYVEETIEHIECVQEAMHSALTNLALRRANHDASKLVEPELSGFQAMAEELKLSETKYGSPEYLAILEKHKWSAVNHHYMVNDHHPQHWATGIKRMSAMAIIEMVCDWYAAAFRMKNGSFAESMRVNVERFNIDEQLAEVIWATANELGLVVNGEWSFHDRVPRV